ncbi:FecR protein [Planctomycetes bacterium Pan216]|uniref:FecR protein n=1 Tax=Kolteria novifilia TaxID=2527975 RepID=A0A518B8R5_9BACT|nr:FecR protein [Planctomycetes bacterium Pan216]
MSAEQRFAELWTDYLEGELDESAIVELRELLAADESLLQRAADMYQVHRLLGVASRDVPKRQEEFVRDVMARLPEKSDDFIDVVMKNVKQLANAGENEIDAPAIRSRSTRPAKRKVSRRIASAALAVAALALVLLAGVSFWPAGTAPIASHDSGSGGGMSGLDDVRFASLAGARFFGELPPPLHSTLAPRRDYVLTNGMAEIAFPSGASAIVEGPAVFRLLSDDALALDVGRCSVHAPKGVEAFRVETPVTQVVDRGTRFTVCVSETSQSEVQVIEGAADIYERSKAQGAADLSGDSIRLTEGEAKEFIKGRRFVDKDIPFNPSVYQRGLPDRVISYEATPTSGDAVENLVSVTVQRGGLVETIPVEELIPIRVTAFRNPAAGAFFCGGEILPEERIATSSDRSLVTGVINPGGSAEPLTSDPVLSGESATPGLAIRFDRPVTNGPGPDVVFFELQTFSNPSDGDAFHVSPLRFRDGLKSHTIRLYDLTMESPNALDLPDFYTHMFSGAVDSLVELESFDTSPHTQGVKFRGLAVGIDLSDLGYDDCETVEGLFIQDALDDRHVVDPVFIGGLPTTRCASAGIENPAGMEEGNQ